MDERGVVEEMNHNEAVPEYLYHYPFTPEDVIVAILPDCSKLSAKEDIAFVRVNAHLGQISYYGKEHPYVDLHQETFAEAKEALLPSLLTHLTHKWVEKSFFRVYFILLTWRQNGSRRTTRCVY